MEMDQHAPPLLCAGVSFWACDPGNKPVTMIITWAYCTVQQGGIRSMDTQAWMIMLHCLRLTAYRNNRIKRIQINNASPTDICAASICSMHFALQSTLTAGLADIYLNNTDIMRQSYGLNTARTYQMYNSCLHVLHRVPTHRSLLIRGRLQNVKSCWFRGAALSGHDVMQPPR